jgi:hypothetical protein
MVRLAADTTTAASTPHQSTDGAPCHMKNLAFNFWKKQPARAESSFADIPCSHRPGAKQGDARKEDDNKDQEE